MDILLERSGTKVTTEVIRRYIEYYDEEETRPNQLDLFDQ
jgi:hypothetical protein